MCGFVWPVLAFECCVYGYQYCMCGTPTANERYESKYKCVHAIRMRTCLHVVYTQFYTTRIVCYGCRMAGRIPGCRDINTHAPPKQRPEHSTKHVCGGLDTIQQKTTLFDRSLSRTVERVWNICGNQECFAVDSMTNQCYFELGE